MPNCKVCGLYIPHAALGKEVESDLEESLAHEFEKAVAARSRGASARSATKNLFLIWRGWEHLKGHD
jgi:hypothetical protein